MQGGRPEPPASSAGGRCALPVIGRHGAVRLRPRACRRPWHAPALALAMLASASACLGEPSRFFFSGDGTIELHHAHFEERIALQYRDQAGRYDPTAVARIQHFFRSRENGSVGEVSLRLIELLDFVEDRFAPKRMVLVSGYRSPELNERLRQGGARTAKASLHTQGIAADVQPVGLDLRQLWTSLRELQVGGVGLYAEDGFLHIDTGRPRFWEPQTSRIDENLSDGNARLFARTDFDRYEDVEGAVLSLHGITSLPLRIAPGARLGEGSLSIEPLTDGVGVENGCYVIHDAAASYRFRVVDGVPLPRRGRADIRLKTCPPRIERTPAEIVSNAVERIQAD